MVVDRYDELITGFGGTARSLPIKHFNACIKTLSMACSISESCRHLLRESVIYPVHSYVRLNTQELAVVTKLNQEKLHQPIVTITHEQKGPSTARPFVVDLAHQVGEPRVRAIETIIAMDP